jgi:hypothetical protein
MRSKSTELFLASNDKAQINNGKFSGKLIEGRIVVTRGQGKEEERVYVWEFSKFSKSSNGCIIRCSQHI